MACHHNIIITTTISSAIIVLLQLLQLTLIAEGVCQTAYVAGINNTGCTGSTAWTAQVPRPTGALSAVWVGAPDDGVSNAVFLPFNFTVGREVFSSIFISSNGFFYFGGAGGGAGCCSGQPLPWRGSALPLVAGFWADLYPPQGGVISYGNVTAASGATKAFMVRFDNIAHYGNTQLLSFNIYLDDAGRVHVNCIACPATGIAHTSGIQFSVNSAMAFLNSSAVVYSGNEWWATSILGNPCDPPSGYNSFNYRSCLGVPSWASTRRNLAGLTSWTGLGDDIVSPEIPMGFSFLYGPGEYTSLYISSNGFIMFGVQGGSGCCSGQPLPYTGFSFPFIAGEFCLL